MTTLLKFFSLAFLSLTFMACTSSGDQTTAAVAEVEEPLVATVLTAESQAALTPDAVIASLKEGNQRYMNNDLTERDLPKQVASTASGQYPEAVILSCLDSRIPVEMVFDKGVGDLFVGRVAGNFVNTDMLGSMEFGCKVAGSKVIVVMGHESCGAVKAAIDDVELGNITEMLTKIKPAVAESGTFEGDKSSKNPDFVTHVSKENVMNAIDDIRNGSPLLKEMEDNGEIKIVGALYDMDSGSVTFLN